MKKQHSNNGSAKGSAPVSPQPALSPRPLSTHDPHLMEKDEQLQLCIQRFVSDAQSMMNQFQEMFIGEVRRFADVCMEFSLAYRSVLEDRDFMSVENRSLKDELEARSGALEMISKELRETREENEELVRRLECLGVSGGGTPGGYGGGSPIIGTSIRIMDPVAMSRHFSVVNSMPAFPRRYSVATSVASYDDDAQTTGSAYLGPSRDLTVPGPTCVSASPTVPSRGSTDNNASHTVLLLTPPVDFKSSDFPGPSCSELPVEIKRRSTSLSRDDIINYINAQQKLDSEASKNRSLDQMTPGPSGVAKSAPVVIQNASELLSPGVSSSTGTFYDAVSTMSSLDNSLSNNDKKDPHTMLTDEINRMCALMIAQATDNDDDYQADIPLDPGCFLGPDAHGNCFISKTPSPSAENYSRHYQLYMSRSHDDAREAALLASQNDSQNEIQSEMDSASSECTISRSGSRKKKAANNPNNLEYLHGTGLTSSMEQLDGFPPGHRFPEFITIIPSPVLEMTRYLLVEVSHFVSPSHFYLIVNDEKCGANAFEDFLEAFQNFYKSLEYLRLEEAENRSASQSNGFGILEDPDQEETEADSEWKQYFTSPPYPDSVTVGSYWAAYMDDDYEWRRIQVIQSVVEVDSTNEIPPYTVRDVDSGYSASVSISLLRPLSEEFGSIPAFAIRASLAYLYPRMQKTESSGSLTAAHTEDPSEWPQDCCDLFERLTYDQILTASIIEIAREDLTETEVAQILLWSSGGTSGNQTGPDDEIFINRKLIELNFAANVADDDRWLQRSNETVNCQSAKSSQVSIHPSPSSSAGAGDPNEKPESVEPASPLTPPVTLKKKKLKTTSVKSKTSKKKKSTSETAEQSEPELSSPHKGEPNQLIGEPGPCFPPALPSSPSSPTSPSSPSSPTLMKGLKAVRSSAIEICASFYLSTSTSSNSLQHLNSDSKLGLTEEEAKCKFPIESCARLHHDPRLSNWIVQKHSRHVKLKKSSHLSSSSSSNYPASSSHSSSNAYPTMCYLFRVTTVFDANKFIGILPFGERKLEIDSIRRYIAQVSPSGCDAAAATAFSKIESPFRQFVLEMTEYYQKYSKDHCLVKQPNSPTSPSTSSSTSNPNQSEYLESYLQNQHQNQPIAFYDTGNGLYLRGYIVGKDPDSPRSDPRPTGSSSNLSQKSLATDTIQQEAKRKTLSLKRPKVKFQIELLEGATGSTTATSSSGSSSPVVGGCSKWIIYGIDTGRYYLIKSSNLFTLVDQFAPTKPFAIVCKLQVQNSAAGGATGTAPALTQLENRPKLHQLIQDRLLCLQFHDIDFSTERNLVSLYRFVVSSIDSAGSTALSTAPQNILNLV